MTSLPAPGKPLAVRGRRGFALPVAIGALVIIAALLAGVFFTSTQEARLGKNTLTQETAYRASEAGLNAALLNWKGTTMGALAVGAVNTTVYDSSSARGFIDTVQITRMSNYAFNIVSIASVASAGTAYSARRRTGMSVRLSYPTFNFLAGLTVSGSITMGGSSYTSGNDTTPSGWSDCPPAAASLPGVATQQRSNVTLSGCTRLSCIDGQPDIKATNTASDTATYFVYGDANYATLTSMATIKYTGSQTLNGMQPSYVSGTSTCDQTDINNWGDNYRATPIAGDCESYFPIVWFQGNGSTVHLTGGRGQGIMLVDGSLQVDGGFEWDGPVIIRGDLITQGTGGHFLGAVMAANINLSSSTVLGNALIQYSNCANTKAILGSAVGKIVAQRGYFDVY